MKYSSVRSLAPSLVVSPDTHPSENYSGDPTDLRARLLISPREIFGEDGICSHGHLDLVVLLVRDPRMTPGIHDIRSKDIVHVLERGQHSAYYRRTERFLNGSLFLTEPVDVDRQRQLHRAVLDDIPYIFLNNTMSPETTVESILRHLSSLASAHPVRP